MGNMNDLHFSFQCDEKHDLVRDFGGARPTIVVLCGSTRFGEAFRAANLAETVAGRIVLSIGCDTKSDTELAEAGDVDFTALKTELDDLHKRKIDLADEVLVLNVGGYVGESTRSEVEYAAQRRKPIRWLEGTDYRRPVTSGSAA